MSKQTKPQALNCPNCGAAVASDKTQCEFCKSRLKTVGCQSCLGLMFLGSKYCPQCGALAVATELLEDENVGECPRCKIGLQKIGIGSFKIRECDRCGGFWANVHTFELICSNQEEQAAVLNFIGSDAHPDSHPPVVKYVPCPECKQLMNRNNFARSSGVIIDICKNHGVWFDADELPKIIEFIRKGGMDRARQKEKLEIAAERDRLREDVRKQALSDRRFGLQGQVDYNMESGIKGFIRSLFE